MYGKVLDVAEAQGRESANGQAGVPANAPDGMPRPGVPYRLPPPPWSAFLRRLMIEVAPGSETPPGGPGVLTWDRASHEGPARDAFVVRYAHADAAGSIEGAGCWGNATVNKSCLQGSSTPSLHDMSLRAFAKHSSSSSSKDDGHQSLMGV